MGAVVDILAFLTLSLDLIILAGFTVSVYEKFFGTIQRLDQVRQFIASRAGEIALLIAAVATSGSLYLSNVKGWTPCRLCWFQRIFMYPLVILLAVDLLFRQDSRDHVLTLSMIGLPIAFYHSLEQRYSQFLSAGCSVFEVSCSTEYTFHYGYITVPVMAFTAFLAILVLMWRFRD